MQTLDSYQGFIRQAVVRGLQLVSDRLAKADILSDDIRDDALAALDMALRPQIASAVWTQTREFILILSPKMEQASYWSSWLPDLYRGLEISQMLEDQTGQAAISLQIGIFQQRQGQLDSAAQWYHASIGHAKAIKEITTWSTALNRLGLIASTQHEADDATAYIEQALELMPECDPQREFSYYVLGKVALVLREYQKAADHFRQSLNLCELSGNKHQMACRLKDLGVAFDGQGMLQAALDIYEQAVDLLQEINDPVEFAITKMNQGNVHINLGKPQAALVCFAEAKPILEKTLNVVNLAKLYNNQGYCYYQLQRWLEAEEMYHASLVQHRQVENWLEYANVLDGLGLLYHEQGHLDKAIMAFRDALQILSDVPDRRISSNLYQEITEHLQKLT